MTALMWPLRPLALGLLAVVAVVGFAARADSQPLRLQPKVEPPKGEPKVEPKGQPANPPARNPIIVHPQFNTLPGIPAAQLNRPAFNPGPFFNPALNNPWMNQTRIVPFNPLFTQPVNPLLVPNNPFVNNPFAPNPFINNPFAPNPFFNNPFAPNPFITGFGPSAAFATSTPPIAIQQPGHLLYRAPDLQVNPVSGLVYRPLSGVARTADGSLFFYVPGTGLPTATGRYAQGTGLYFNPEAGTFLNPSTGVLSRPGTTTVFMPWIR